jgi:hypothetical protein
VPKNLSFGVVDPEPSDRWRDPQAGQVRYGSSQRIGSDLVLVWDSVPVEYSRNVLK